MKNLIFIFLLSVSVTVFAQDTKRQMILGQVMYRSSNVINEHVINTTSLETTLTDEQGRFGIEVALGDELVFTAVNYQIKAITITPEMMAAHRLVVEVNEKVVVLDEVVISPENREKFLALKNEEFKAYVYEIDRGSKVENIAESPTVRGMKNGINFVNIFKAIYQGADEKKAPDSSSIPLSVLLRSVYDDSFFVNDLLIPVDKINEYLLYCENQLPTKSLLLKKNEFELIEFLVAQSQTFLKE